MDPIPDLSALDLRLLPDWLRETPGSRSSPHPAPSAWDGSEHPGAGSDAASGRHADRRDRRREDKGGRDRFRSSEPRGHGRNRHPAGGPDRRGRRQEPQERDRRPHAEPTRPAEVDVEILPEPHVVERLAAHIRQSRAAHSLIGLAQLFLQAPERFRIRLRARVAERPLHWIAPDGPAAQDPALLARPAFRLQRETLYRKEEVTIDPPKGAFASVARCPLSNTVLGPTSFHTFQADIRSLYERRFRHRMSFERYRAQIETVSDPAAVEAWKASVSRKVVFSLPPAGEGEPAIPIGSEEDAYAHFREHFLPGLLRSADQTELAGPHAVRSPDPALTAAVRHALTEESRFPGRLAHALQGALARHGIHLWKHRKRYLFLSAVRPHPFAGDRALLSDLARSILAHVEAHPRCSRRDLATALLPAAAAAPGAPTAAPAGTDPAQPTAEADPLPHAPSAGDTDPARRELAASLHFLIEAGHLILFQDGALDLPLPPKSAPAPSPAAGPESAAVQPQQ